MVKCKGGYILICRQVYEFSLASLGEQVLKDFINEIGRKVRDFTEEITMKRLNGSDIDQTILYLRIHCVKFIMAVLERHSWSYPGNNKENSIERIHPELFKELEINPVPYNETEAKYILDKMGFKYIENIGGIIFVDVLGRPYIPNVVE